MKFCIAERFEKGKTAMHSQTSDCLVDLIDSEAEAEINEKKQTETKSGI